MKRHIIAGHFGSSDRVNLPTGSDDRLTKLDLLSGRLTLGHGIGKAIKNLRSLDIFPSETGLDLLIVAAHVCAADNRISREDESQDTWTREITLYVPVSDLSLWNPCVPILQRLLNFLTGDLWTLKFRQRPSAFNTLLTKKSAKTPNPRFNDIGLFSGGLDSLIGTIDSLEQGKIPLLISHAADGSTSTAQNFLFDKIKKHYRALPLDRLRIWMSFPSNLIRGVKPENTTRGRSFLFFAAGIFAGTGLNQSFTLRVPENGLIALNVPLDPLRLGSLSTRTTHPYYMARWNELLKLLNIDASVKNEYWDKTKGEMISNCRNPSLLKSLTPRSMSCSSPSKGRWLGLSTQHCGYCLPCLIRRASIKTGIGTDNTTYTIDDLTAYNLDTLEAEGKQVRSFQFAISRIKRNKSLAKMLIHKSGPLTDEPNNWSALEGVYVRGLNEVSKILDRVITSPS